MSHGELPIRLRQQPPLFERQRLREQECVLYITRREDVVTGSVRAEARYLGHWEAEEEEGAIVAVDVIRAFTTAAYAFAAGAREIYLVREVEEALAFKRQHPEMRLPSRWKPGAMHAASASRASTSRACNLVVGLELSGACDDILAWGRRSAGVSWLARAA